MPIKFCPKCQRKLSLANAIAGRSGSTADKVRAARASAIVRARNALKLTLHGKTMTVTQWAKKTGIPRSTLWKRLNHPRPKTAAQVLAK